MDGSDSIKRGLVRLVEAVRIVGTGVGFYFAYAAWTEPSSPDSIRILALTLAIPMCGSCAVEGLLLGRATAREKGYGSAGDAAIDPYQIQNALWFLAVSVCGVIWGLWFPAAIQAFVFYVVMVFAFFLLSAVNHAVQAVRHGNRTWQNLDRPFLAAAMIGGGLPIIVSYL